MSAVSPLRKRLLAKPPDEAEGHLKAIVSGIRTMLLGLSETERARVLQELTSMLGELPTPHRGGEVLGAIVRLLPERDHWTVEDIKKGVESQGVDASSKSVYNAVGYLNRKGTLRRVGYGRYVANGIEVVTAEDLGGENARHEDLYREPSV